MPVLVDELNFFETIGKIWRDFDQKYGGRFPFSKCAY